MKTLNEVVDSIFGKRVLAADDPDGTKAIREITARNKAVLDELRENEIMQRLSAEEAAAMLRDFQALPVYERTIKMTLRFVARAVMNGYQMGVILGREVQKEANAEPRVKLVQ